jgi:hypothetical protein
MLTEFGIFGARVRPFNTGLKEQVLVVGLGQVGLLALARLNTMLDQTLPPRLKRDHLRLLAIASRKSIRQEQLLPRENRLLFKADPLRWSDVPGRFAAQGVAKWWPRTPNHPSLQADPTPTRAFGRFLLWTNAEVVSEKLYELGEWLQLSSERTQSPRTILILASLAEGEGSGMIFDVAGRLRYIMGRQPTQIIGILSADADFENDEQALIAKATVYAALKELDAANLQPEIYTHDLPLIGRVQQLPSVAPLRPLDHLCITGGTNQRTPDPEGPLTEFAITWLYSLLANSPYSSLLPLNLQANPNRNNAYTAFGVAKLSLPVREVLTYHSIQTAKTVLANLLLPYPEAVEGWVQNTLSRVHTDLLTQNLHEHHLLTDKLRDIQRRIAPSALSARYKTASNIPGGWPAILEKEWELLKQENIAADVDRDGVSKPRESLRRRMENALEDGLRSLINEVEAQAVKLAFADGWGLRWTARAYEGLLSQVKQALEKMHSKQVGAALELERTGKQWLTMANARQFGMLEKTNQDLLQALLAWIGWQAREKAWAEFNSALQDLHQRLGLAIQQLPREVEQLEQMALVLRAELDSALRQETSFPNAAVLTDAWVREGVRQLPSADHLPPHELVGETFKRWDPGDLPPPRQLQKFPSEILNAVRLLLQPHSNFASLREVLTRQDNPAHSQRLLDQLGQAAAPAWAVSAVTDRLDANFSPPLAIEIVREDPHPMSLMPAPAQERIKRLTLPSPDPDELVTLRVTHGWSAEYVQRLRNDYRRAYYRVLSDNIPLHIDRRWETTLADLIHTSLRTEVSDLWDTAVRDNLRGPRYAQDSTLKLSNALAAALEVNLEQVLRPKPLAEDIWLHIYPMPPFRLKIPPPMCSFIYLLSHRSTADIADDLYRTIAPRPPEENFFFLVNVAGRNDLKRILEPLQAQGFMALDLGEADIKHIISAPKPTNALRDIVIERIDLTAISPFYTRAPVPDHMFFGREKEIADIRSKLNTHSVVLIGGRRIGKTSTLQKVYRTMQGEQSLMMPYYLDCSNMFKQRHLFRRIQQDWGIEVEDMDDPIEFDQVVASLWKRHLGKTPVFLLDEVDRLLKTDQGESYDEPLFRTFRSLSNEKRCQFVFSGEKLLLNSLGNANSVLFNFPQKVKLSPLQKEVVHRLVSEPFEMLNIWLENVDEVIQKIFELSAGHPNIVQTICHALVEVVDKEKSANLLNMRHLGQVLDWHPVQADIVDTIWGQMYPLSKLLTLLWPENADKMTLEEILHLIRRAGLKTVLTQTVKDQVLPDLELYNFLRQEGQIYYLIPIHFPTLLDAMTNKRLEVQAILEAHQQREPAR